MEFSRQEYWSELPCPPPGDLPNPWIEPVVFSCFGRQVLYHWHHLGSPTVSTLGIKKNFVFSLYLLLSLKIKETLWLSSWIWFLAVQLWDQRVVLVQATVTEYHNSVAYKHQKFISHYSGAWKSEIRLPVWTSSSEGPLPGCQCPFSYCILTWQGQSKRALWGLLYKSTNPIHECSTLMS